MKMFKLLALSMIILPFFFSCSDDNSDPEPIIPKAKLKLEVKLSSSTSESTVNGEVVSKVDYNMSNIGSLIYVVHRADNGQFLKLYNLDAKALEAITKDGVTTLEDDNLPFGSYYISLVVTTQDKLDSKLLEGLSKEYSKAACQVPNNHIYYKTMEVACELPNDMSPEFVKEDLEFNVEAQLQLITGEFVFLLPEGSKGIPAGANFNMTMEVTNVPSAFFLKSGKTLNNKEVKELDLYKYNNKFEITNRFDKQLVAKYYMLANHELEDSAEERGYFKFIYKEDAASNVETKSIGIKFPERKQDENHYDNGAIYLYELYSGANSPVEIDPKVTTFKEEN